MKESYIRQRAVKILESQDFIVWYPAKVMYKENDVFGIYDLIAVNNEGVRWIQLTTLSNISARKKKILDKIKLYPQLKQLQSEVWGYNKVKHLFVKICL